MDGYDSYLPAPGDLIADTYRVEGVIGQGGMGVVLAATHTGSNERVAIKFLLPAASEYPDHAHPVRVVVAEHRDWYTGVLTTLLADLGHRMPGDAADELMLAFDGARSGGYAGDPIAATAALGRVADSVLTAVKK